MSSCVIFVFVQNYIKMLLLYVGTHTLILISLSNKNVAFKNQIVRWNIPTCKSSKDYITDTRNIIEQYEFETQNKYNKNIYLKENIIILCFQKTDANTKHRDIFATIPEQVSFSCM